MIERMKPTRGRLLVKLIKTPEGLSAGGLYIPEKLGESNETLKGSVMAMGDCLIVDGKEVPHDIKNGDTVIFKYYSGFFVDPERNYMIVEAKDILTLVEKE